MVASSLLLPLLSLNSVLAWQKNKLGMWYVQDKREFDEATVLHWMGKSQGRAGREEQVMRIATIFT